MSGINLPRGRTTDALVAVAAAAAVVQLAPAVRLAVLPYGFIPGFFVAGGWSDAVAWLSPLVSQFLLGGIAAVLFNTVFLLIAGRYAEHALGGPGMLAVFAAGAYGGAIARTMLTWGSMVPTMGADAGLFALIGAYMMLYGVPSALPINRTYSRPMQIAALAGIWCLFQLVFMLASGVFELSVSIVNPLGGLLIGALIARPILRWRYRKA